MHAEELDFKVLVERPVVRGDVASEVDIAVDIIASRGIDSNTPDHALNLCVVVDRSGSMNSDGKLEQAKKACIDIYRSLNPGDHFTMLAFDDEVISIVNPQTPADDVLNRIRSLRPGGQTDLSKGWYLGLLELQTYATDRHINRLILLSDGMANKGEVKASVLGAESGRARDELSITTSTVGVGSDFQEDILMALARQSGGRFWYFGDSRIEEIIREEFSGALSVRFERPNVQRAGDRRRQRRQARLHAVGRRGHGDRLPERGLHPQRPVRSHPRSGRAPIGVRLPPGAGSRWPLPVCGRIGVGAVARTDDRLGGRSAHAPPAGCARCQGGADAFRTGGRSVRSR